MGNRTNTAPEFIKHKTGLQRLFDYLVNLLSTIKMTDSDKWLLFFVNLRQA